MRQHFIHRQNRPELTLFMAGWGMDEHPFADCRTEDTDLMVAYDYRSLDFDRSLLDGYNRIHLVAWSMGVWASAEAFRDSGLPWGERIAVCGTPFPVNDERGIPRSIFDGTLQRLNDATLHKFLRRMCGSPAALAEFLERRPRRTVEELKEELACIGSMASRSLVPSFPWTRAFVGENDLIFPARNQLNAWQTLHVPVTAEPVAHYDRRQLNTIICNPTTHLWKKE